jgi:hypothetical protein
MEFFPAKQKKDLKSDMIRSLFFSLVPLMIIVSVFLSKYSLVLDQSKFSVLLRLLAGSLFLTFTLYALILSILNQKTDNPVIKMLREENRYNQLLDRFKNSIKGMSYSFLFILVLFLIYSTPSSDIIILFFYFALIPSGVFFLIRLYRCADLVFTIEEKSRRADNGEITFGDL